MYIVIAQAVIDGLLNAGIFGLAAVGLTLLFGVMRVVNFAHGDLLMVGMYATYVLYSAGHIHPYLSAVIVVPALALLGVAMYRFLLRPLSGAPEHAQLLVTLGLSMVLQNVVLSLFGADFRSINVPVSNEAFELGAIVLPAARLYGFVVGMGACIALYLFLRYTDFGVITRAAVQDRTAAALAGIDVERVLVISTAIAVGLLGLAAAWLVPMVYLSSEVGHTYLLPSFIIVILGGMGSVRGAILGSIVYGLSQSLGAVLVPGSLGILVPLITFVALLLVRPSGLFRGTV
ncbi:branched-chain amino acid transport system / permease component family protein [Paraburkholderia xenovorans LB400]|uniref:Amino acid/amide ABC transporter membrane protein 1, HAAT family n=1 Tax=Paraburkholderia xenovorans (strain LB400) TaxID=266265 RepID=Q13GP8_PARXL|nr:branched-chain amino acid ABC transporter permease [Paraburkholderia xenovorans]ABE36741.1 amino acid/amide ABC transporter membrane protein 1, HAAT family [Paraburkholderia xenovorans LB400]AIP34650.1 branched-chain amino acid transport system / permease component family protein [Paraburkholderia xenovorans LB400]